MDRKTLIKPYMWLVIVGGVGACVHSALTLPYDQLDLRFYLLAFITVTISSRLSVRIPRVRGHITVSDTFIFLTLLLYGGGAAVLVAGAEAFYSAQRFSKRSIYIKPLTITFNSAMMALSTFVTAQVLTYLFGNVTALPHGEFSGTFVAALSVMGLVQYVSNSSLAAVHSACKLDQSGWQTWNKYYLWASITYFAGASAAGIIAKVADVAGFYALIATAPIIAIVYFTYRTYLENIDAMSAAAQAEAAAAARAVAAAQQAEQARQHVEELSHYIAEQERIREQYAQVEKMSALGELASGVAHDFNNTLAGILGRAQLLLMTKDPEKIESGLRVIIKTAKDGARTVKRIQDFARQRRDHDFQSVSMDQVLLDVREITRPRWKNSSEAEGVQISLELQLGTDEVAVMGDESELREVLVNMVFNAVDAMPQGGRITLSTKRVDDEVEITVADTGTGMPDEVRSRVFDPFFTTKGKAGMGLGLAVSYGIIRRHGGTVEVESEPGRGSTFRFRLPVATEAAAQPKTTAETPALAEQPAEEKRAKVLVVDDEAHIRDLLKDILESEGCAVRVADGGNTALELFRSESFDAVFTDLGMKGMSGWELAGAIREMDEKVPLAVVTGWGEAVGSFEQTAARVDWVVAKPFDNAQIASIVRDVARRGDDAPAPAGAVV